MRHALCTISNSAHAFGGVSSWIERVTAALPEYGWRVTTVTHALDAAHLAPWEHRHPNMRIEPLFGRFVRPDHIEPALEAFLDRTKPDVVVVNASYWMMPTLQRRKHRGDALRLVGVAHADSSMYYDALGFYRDCFDHAIGVSHTCYQRLLTIGYPPERASFLPYGVPCPPRVPVRTPSGPLRLAYVGRLVQSQKRILDFIPLVQALNGRNVDYRLDFFGTGPEEAALRTALAALDHDGRIQFRGWVPSEEVLTKIWPAVDIFMLLSEYEGLSISMLEAMGSGAVPVVSRVGSGVEDVIREGQTGLSFPIGDLERCADLVASLDRDRSRLAAMSRAAWDLVRERYALPLHAARLAALFDATVQQPARLGPARYRGLTAHPLARLLPPWALVQARRLLKRGNPENEGFTSFP